MKPFTFLIALFSLIILINFKQEKKQTETSKTQFVKSSDGIGIAYQVYGNGEIPLIFVHGWCCDKSYWKHQANYFKNQYKVVIIDFAGHGESSIGRNSYTIQMFANDVTAVINQLKLNDFILIGHSLGGHVILETAIQNLEKTRAIFPIDSYSTIPKVKTKEELIAMEKEQRSQWAVADFQSKVYNWVKGWYHPASDSTLMNWIAKDMSTNDPTAGIDAIVNFNQYRVKDFSNSLKSINDIPVICIGSRTKPNKNKFRKFGINFNAVQMDGVGHFLMMSHPEPFNELLDEQLQKLLSDSSD